MFGLSASTPCHRHQSRKCYLTSHHQQSFLIKHLKKSRKDKESHSFYTVVLSPDGVPEQSIHYCKWAQLKVRYRNICKAGVKLKRSENLKEAAGYWAAQRPDELPIYIYHEPHSNKGYSFDASSGVKTPWVFVESTVALSHEDFLVMARNN